MRAGPRLGNSLSGEDVGQAAAALSLAASKLRGAASKAQALSAIPQRRTRFLGALAKVRAIGGHVAGCGGDSAAYARGERQNAQPRRQADPDHGVIGG